MSFFLTPEEVAALGLAACGSNVSIDRDARLINPQRIHIGDNVRIDAQAILSAGPDGIRIGSWVHIAAGAYLYGGGGAILIEDFTVVSGRAVLFTVSDDALHSHLHGWMVPERFMRLSKGPITLRRHSGVGAGAIVMPGVELGYGSCIGAMSMARRSIRDCIVMYGHPARPLGKPRDRVKIERLEAEFLASQGGAGQGTADPEDTTCRE